MNRNDGVAHMSGRAEDLGTGRSSRLRLLVVLLASGAAAVTVAVATRRGVRSIVERVRGRVDAVLDDAHLVSGRVSKATQVVGETAASVVEGPDPARVVDPTAPTEHRSVRTR